MANLDELIVSIAKAAGLDPEKNEAIIAIRKDDQLTKVEIDTVTKNVILNNLMNTEAAVNNPTVLEKVKEKLGNEFLATKLNGIDALIEKSVGEFELSDETLAAIKSESKTSKKIAIYNQAMKESYEKKGASSKDKQAYIDEIGNLNRKILAIEGEKQSAIESQKTEYLSKMQSRDYNNFLNQYNFATNDTLDRETAMIVADTKFKKSLAEKGFKLVYNPDDTELFKVVTTSDTEAYEQNQPVKFKMLMDKIIADNKLLNVSGGGGNNNPPQNPTPTFLTNQGQTNMDSIVSEMSEQVAQLQTK